MPGSALDLPYLCPMDHVFGVEDWMSTRLPADAGGPRVDFREFSFLLVRAGMRLHWTPSVVVGASRGADRHGRNTEGVPAHARVVTPIHRVQPHLSAARRTRS